MNYFKLTSLIYAKCMFLVLVLIISSSATIINIPADYSTIQAGIDASSDGDTVLVQPGTYVENINFNGHDIVLGSLFLITGDTSYIEQTVIDGYNSGSVVVFENEEDSTTIITGFTIQNGYAEYGGGIFCSNNSSPTISNNMIKENCTEPWGYGGGIYCVNSNPTLCNNTISANYTYCGAGICCLDYSSPTISNNYISGNIADFGSGGGIFCLDYSSPEIINNRITRNTASDPGGGIACHRSNPIISNNFINGNFAFGRWNIGGGIYCINSTSIIDNNTISGNFAEYGGGGIYCRISNPTISNNTIAGNSANYCGGGIYCSAPSPIISNNTITGNSATYGGGIYCVNSNPTLCNNTISANSADLNGSGISCYYGSSPIVVNTILWANLVDSNFNVIYFDDISSLSITYSNIQDTIWPGDGNIDINPLFRDPENGDFHLMATYCGDPYNSPCIDMGHPAILDSLLDCDWGLGELRSDMGAYSGGDSAEVSIDDKNSRLPYRVVLSQNYPNPFNAVTTIQYTLPKTSDVAIDIYDILGRKVETLINIKQQAGNHQIIWDASEKSSGIYFYRLQAGDISESKRMVLLK